MDRICRFRLLRFYSSSDSKGNDWTINVPVTIYNGTRLEIASALWNATRLSSTKLHQSRATIAPTPPIPISDSITRYRYCQNLTVTGFLLPAKLAKATNVDGASKKMDGLYTKNGRSRIWNTYYNRENSLNHFIKLFLTAKIRISNKISILYIKYIFSIGGSN